MKRIVLIIVNLIVLSYGVLASYRVGTLGWHEGLDNCYVLSLAEDNDGHIYIGTEHGLYRSDGYRVRGDMFGGGAVSCAPLSRMSISRLLYDAAQNRLYVGSRFDGLSSVDLNTYECRSYDALPGREITGLLKTADGTLLLTFGDAAGLLRLDPTTGEAEPVAANAEWQRQAFADLAQLPDHRLVLTSSKNGIFLYTPGAGVVNFNRDNSSLATNFCRRLLVDSQGLVWVATLQGIALLEAATNDLRMLPGITDNVFCVAEDAERHLWYGTELLGVCELDMSAALYDGRTDNLQRYTPDTWPAVSNKTTKALLLDRHGNILVGSYGGGLDIFTHRPSPVNFLTPKSRPLALTHPEVKAVACDGEDVYVALDGGGIDEIKPNVVTNYNTSNSRLVDVAVLSAYRDRKGNLWFGSYGSQLAVVHPSAAHRQPLAIDTRPLYDIRDIDELPEGGLLLASSRGFGIYHVEADSMEVLIPGRGRGNTRVVRCICADGERIYCGSEHHGFDIYDHRGSLLRHLAPQDGLSSDNIVDCAVDTFNTEIREKKKEGRGTVLYIATPEGLDRYDVAADSLVRGLVAGEIRALLMTADGKLWIAGTNRLMRYEPRTGQMTDFTYLTRSLSGDFSPRGLGLRNDGSLLVAAHEGLFVLYPELTASLPVPPLHICALTYRDDEEQGADSVFFNPARRSIKVPHTHTNLTVEYSVLDASLCGLVEYSYSLNGAAWQNNGTLNHLTFRHLSPGEYELRLRAAIPGQEAVADAALLRFTIRPPWWRSGWAILLYALLLLAAAALLTRHFFNQLRLRQQYALERQQREQDKRIGEEKLRFFTNITHELRTPLSLIIGPVDDLAADKRLPDYATRKLQVVEKNAQRLLALINEILEFRKTETQNRKLCVRRGSLEALVREQVLRYNELNRNAALQLQLDIAPGDYTFYFDPEAVGTILDNLLSNALKYTKQGSIVVGLKHVEAWTELTVRDTGKGISAKALPHIFERYYQDNSDPNVTSTGIGLALVANLSKLHEGEVSVASEGEGRGSTFTFRLRTGNTYPEAAHSAEVAATLNEQYAAEIMDGPAAAEQKSVILIVEDNEEIRQYAAEALSEVYAVHQAADGLEGLQMAQQLIPDLIVTDVMMPNLDGIEMTRRLKADVATSHIPVVILTAKASVEDRTEAYQLGAESFIPKPFTARLLRARVDNILQRQRLLVQSLGAANAQRHGEAEKARVYQEALSELDRQWLEKLDKLIDDNIASEQLDINFLSSNMAMSISTLYRKTKALTGQAANFYVRKRKAHRAEQLLLTGKYTISEVALMVGYSSLSNFRELFKSEFGVPPSEWIKGLGIRD